MEGSERVISAVPGLLLVEEGGGRFSTIFQHRGGVQGRLPFTTPAKDFIAATEIGCRAYRREVKRLWEGHTLFATRLDIPVVDFEDFVEEALLLPSMLQKIDPVSFFVLRRSCCMCWRDRF